MKRIKFKRMGIKAKDLLNLVRLARKITWPGLIFLIVGVILIGAGKYFFEKPAWTQQNWVQFYNKGVTAYENRNSQGALEWFQFVGQGAKDEQLRAKALYNLGTLIGEEAFNEKIKPEQRIRAAQEAIIKLNRAIELDPFDEDSKVNKEILENMLKILLKKLLPSPFSIKEKENSKPNYSPGKDPTGV